VNQNNTYKLHLLIVKYLGRDFLAELRYVQIQEDGTEFIYASLSMPIAVFFKMINAHGSFNLAEQGYYNYTLTASSAATEAPLTAPSSTQEDSSELAEVESTLRDHTFNVEFMLSAARAKVTKGQPVKSAKERKRNKQACD